MFIFLANNGFGGSREVCEDDTVEESTETNTEEFDEARD